jgi:hypothetical protein
MERVLKDVPEMPREMPPGIVVLPTGPYPTAAGENRVVNEFFFREAVPPPEVLHPPVPVEPTEPTPAPPGQPGPTPSGPAPVVLPPTPVPTPAPRPPA